MSDSQVPRRQSLSEVITQIVELAGIWATKIAEIHRQFEAAVVKAEPYIRNFVENVNAIPGLTRELSLVLQRRGWYILPQITFTEVGELVQVAHEEDFERVDALMSELVGQHADEIAADLISRFPKRAALLREAFDNHLDGRYASAITLLLTQADGFCKDLLEVPYFSIQRNAKLSPPEPQTRRKIEELSLAPGDFVLAVMEPLLTRGGMNASSGEYADYPDTLHRNPVLHGDSTDFGSEINSLKTISLAAYLGVLAADAINAAKAEALK